MYQTSQEYKNLVYAEGTQHLLKIYIEENEVSPEHIASFMVSGNALSENKVSLGSTESRKIEMRIGQQSLPETYENFYIESGIRINGNDEIVPIGYFVLEDIKKNDDNTVTIQAVDYMLQFERIINAKEILPCTTAELLVYLCKACGVELGSVSFINNDVIISEYDDTLTARQMVGYIAEQAGGFACIGRDGKLYIKKIGETVIDFDIGYFQNFNWGEKFRCNEVTFNNEEKTYYISDTTVDGVYLDCVLESSLYNNSVVGTNIEIDPNNLYIKTEEQLKKVYNQVKDLEIYGFEGSTIIDPAIDVGDIMKIGDKKIVYQGDMEYLRKFKATITSNIEVQKKKETTVGSTLSYATRMRILRGQVEEKASKNEVIPIINKKSNLTINENTGNVKMQTGNVTIDEDGIHDKEGQDIVNKNGLMSNLQFNSLEWKQMGYWAEVSGNFDGYFKIDIPVIIPSDFTIERAYITLQHCPIKYTHNNNTYWGYSRNIGLYISQETEEFHQNIEWNSESEISGYYPDEEIEQAFGENGYTPSTPTDESQKLESKTSIDLSEYIEKGKIIILQIRSKNTIPDWVQDINDDNFSPTLAKQTGCCRATLNVLGYKKGGSQ